MKWRQNAEKNLGRDQVLGHITDILRKWAKEHDMEWRFPTPGALWVAGW